MKRHACRADMHTGDRSIADRKELGVVTLDHIGIINRGEEEALRFYRDLLGMEKIKDSVVTPELSQQLFSLRQEIRMLVFGKENTKVEVFILPGFNPPSPNIPHFCLQVHNFPEFIERIQQSGSQVITGQRNGRTVHFIEDFSGNRIEIKPY
jgi:catechol 2,3-dioxygenase-like lactoylglutathione lyase family enzyme